MSGVDLIAKLLMPHGKHGTSASEGAMETPLAVGESLYEVPFGGTLGKPFLEKLLAMGLVGLHVLLREDDDLAGEAVAGGIEAGALFASGGARACAVLRISAICFDLKIGHKE